jgi:hypothetical protein
MFLNLTFLQELLPKNMLTPCHTTPKEQIDQSIHFSILDLCLLAPTSSAFTALSGIEAARFSFPFASWRFSGFCSCRCHRGWLLF